MDIDYKALNVDLQTNYPNTPYNWKGGNGKTIYTSGCCPTSVRNILVNLGVAKLSTERACEIARSCGARVDGGTVPDILLKELKRMYGYFTYTYTCSDTVARAHAKNGMVLCHTTGANKVFSTSGHFVAMANCVNDTVTIIDPYITTNKWRIYGRKNIVRLTDKSGVVTVSTKVSDESFDYYYLISAVALPKEDDEVVTKTKHSILGKNVELDAITKDGVTYVALRALCKELGYVVDYDSATGKRIISTDNVVVTRNGVSMQIPGTYANGTNYVAARPLLDAEGYTDITGNAFVVNANKKD